MPHQSLCVIIPVLNEERMIGPLAEALFPVLEETGLDWSVLFVDDGSTDGTMAGIRALAAGNPRVKALSFSRNFGKEQAMAAGLRAADADAVILMDADLQHPPAAIPAFIAQWKAGAQIVYGQRGNREADSFMRRATSDAFHAVYGAMAGGRLPRGIVDFVLLDRAAVAAMNRLDERARFTKGMFAWIGFRAAVVPFDSPDRLIGETRFNYLKLLRFALDGIASFSTLPLRMWTYIGGTISLLALLYAAYFLIKTLLFHTDVPGFPSIIVSIMFFSGVQLLSLGIIGEYVGRIFEEVKRRPLYIVAETVGMEAPAETAPAKAPDA
ncbi:MAG: glycosyltransferase family 2 protein [Paracoccaceae bacterium]|nr:glycosyltransferase family 2 protein [Paracoccaceae bacterium]